MTDTSVADTTPPNGAANAALNSPPPPPPFWDGFSDAGLKTAAEKSGLKSAEEVFARAQKFDAFKDADPAELVRIGKDVKPEDALKIMQERFGAPKEGAAYKLTEIEGVDKPTAEWAQGVFAKAGLSPWQAQLIASEQMEMMKTQTANTIAEDKAGADREMAALQAPGGWGAQFPASHTENLEIARRAMKFAGAKAGLTAEQTTQAINDMESITGTANVLRMLRVFGAFVKEGEFIDGAQTPQGKSLLEKLYPKDVEKDRAARG